MGKKGLTSIFSRRVDSPGAAAAESHSPSPPWPWPSCRNNPQTTSFREDDQPCTTAGITATSGPAATRCRRAGEMYKTVNSVYLDCSADNSCFGDDDDEGRVVLDDDSCFSTTTASEEWSEAVIRSLGRTSTDRFFFDAGPASNSILAAASPPSPGKSTPAEAKAAVLSDDDEKKLPEPSTSLVEESVAVAVDSNDPYRDFRASMEEMVAAHGLRGWEALEELLVWYLRINGKHNHALIVGAFVDLLVGLATSPSAAATTTTITTTSSSSSASTASTSTSSTCDGDVTTTTATMEQCGGGNGNDASFSSASSDQEAAVVGEEKASDHHRSRNTLAS